MLELQCTQLYCFCIIASTWCIFPTHGACFPHMGHVSCTQDMFPTHRTCFHTWGLFPTQRTCFPHGTCFPHMGHVSHIWGMFPTWDMFPTHRACFPHTDIFLTHGSQEACFPHTGHGSCTWDMFPTHMACFSKLHYNFFHVSQTQGMIPIHRACVLNTDIFLAHGSQEACFTPCFMHMGHVSHSHGMFLQTSLQFFSTKFIDKIFQKFMHHMWETCPICGKHDPCLKNMLHVWET